MVQDRFSLPDPAEVVEEQDNFSLLEPVEDPDRFHLPDAAEVMEEQDNFSLPGPLEVVEHPDSVRLL
jgi:hypothetical protein